MDIKSNISGTLADRFKIGKGGPTIRQGDEAPSNLIGGDGDLFLVKAATSDIFFKDGSWISLLSDGPYARQEIARGVDDAIEPETTYVAIISGSGSPSTITLPTGVNAMEITIKDELGSAATYPVEILSASGDLIENEIGLSLASNYGSVTLSFRDGNWYVTRRTEGDLMPVPFWATITGNDVATQFTVNHPFDTRDVMVEVRENFGDFRDVEIAVSRPNATSIVLSADDPIPDGYAYRVRITK
jgi:hypothetical protein